MVKQKRFKLFLLPAIIASSYLSSCGFINGESENEVKDETSHVEDVTPSNKTEGTVSSATQEVNEEENEVIPNPEPEEVNLEDPGDPDPGELSEPDPSDPEEPEPGDPEDPNLDSEPDPEPEPDPDPEPEPDPYLEVEYSNGDACEEMHLIYDTGSSSTAGRSKQLYVRSNDSNPTFTSSNETVATVTSTGLVRAISANAECTITISTSKGLSKQVAVKTYNEANYYKLNSNNYSTGCVDRYAEELVFPSVCKKISTDYTYNDMPILRRVVFNEGFTAFPNFVFCNIPNLEYVEIPSTLTKLHISLNGFCNAKQIKIASGNTEYRTINNNLLICTSNATSTRQQMRKAIITWYNDFNGTVPSNIVSDYGIDQIFMSGFAYGNFDTLTIPEGMVNVNTYAFLYLKANTVILPSTVNIAPAYSQYWGTSIGKVQRRGGDGTIYSDTNYTYKVYSGCVLKNKEILFGARDYAIPTNSSYVTSIGQQAYFNRGLTDTIKIPDNITSIGKDAFLRNPGVNKILLPSSVTTFTKATGQIDQYLPSPIGKLRDHTWYNNDGFDRGPFGQCNSNTVIYSNIASSTFLGTDATYAFAIRKGIGTSVYSYNQVTSSALAAMY